MVKYCVAAGCKEYGRKGSNIQFHRFPFHRPHILKQWEDRVGLQRTNWRATIHSHLCSRHFAQDAYRVRPGVLIRWLKEDAVPSIFDFPLHHEEKKLIVFKDLKPPEENKLKIFGELRNDVDNKPLIAEDSYDFIKNKPLKTETSNHFIENKPLKAEDSNHFVDTKLSVFEDSIRHVESMLSMVPSLREENTSNNAMMHAQILNTELVDDAEEIAPFNISGYLLNAKFELEELEEEPSPFIIKFEIEEDAEFKHELEDNTLLEEDNLIKHTHITENSSSKYRQKGSFMQDYTKRSEETHSDDLLHKCGKEACNKRRTKGSSRQEKNQKKRRKYESI